MSGNVTYSPVDLNATIRICSRTFDPLCWQEMVDVLNQAFASMMAAVEAFMITMMVVGTLGNSIVLITYANKSKKSTANIYIMFLAATDLFSCCVIHPYVVFKLFHSYDQTWFVACKIFEYLIHSSLSISSLTLLVIAVDRYYAICRPLQFLHMFNEPLRIVLATSLVGALFSIPILEFYWSKEEMFEVDGVSVVAYRCDYGSQYHGSLWMQMYSACFLVLFIIEIVIITILYLLVAKVSYYNRRTVVPLNPSQDGVSPVTSQMGIGTAGTSDTSSSAYKTSTVRESRELQSIESNKLKPVWISLSSKRPSTDTGQAGHRQRHNAVDLSARMQQRSRLKAAKLLSLVTLVFLLSWLPFFVLRITYIMYSNTFWVETTFRRVMEHLLNHFFYINNAANPILYAIICKSFRLDFCKLVKKHCMCRT